MQENNSPASITVTQNNSIETTKDATAFTTVNQNTKIPILMYHYIRDYNNHNDKVGANLSVPPQVFNNQLEVLKQKGYTPITFNDVVNGKLPQKPIILTFDDGYADFYQNAFPILKQKNMTAVSYIITSFKNGNYMSDDQIKEISVYGIEIGSHTIDHPDLSKTSEAKAEREINQSKKDLEALIGKSIVSFCYPAGKYNDQTIEITRKAGFKYATTTKAGIGEIRHPFELSRYRITSESDLNKILP